MTDPVISELEAIRAEQELLPMCSDCPPVGYPTNKTRCLPCPRKQALRDLQRLGQEWDYPERLQVRDDEEPRGKLDWLFDGIFALVCFVTPGNRRG